MQIITLRTKTNLIISKETPNLRIRHCIKHDKSTYTDVVTTTGVCIYCIKGLVK